MKHSQEASEKVYQNTQLLLVKSKWKWDVFGEGSLTVTSPYLNPTLYRRFISGLVLGSKWTRLKNDQQL